MQTQEERRGQLPDATPCVMSTQPPGLPWHHPPSAKTQIPNIDSEMIEKNRFLSLKFFKGHIKVVGLNFPFMYWHCVNAFVVSKLSRSSGGAYDGHYHYLGLIILPSTTRVFPGHEQEGAVVIFLRSSLLIILLLFVNA